jgi:hypothetical protein
MTWDEPDDASIRRAPTWSLSDPPTAGVKPQTANGYEYMLARLDPKGDISPLTRLTVLGEAGRIQHSLEQSGLDQHIAGSAGAVITHVFQPMVTTTQ